jgi:hypothetical protein
MMHGLARIFLPVEGFRQRKIPAFQPITSRVR